MLTLAGLSLYAFSWKIGLAVALVMLVVVASYRQNVQAYQSGGGDYEVATVNIGATCRTGRRERAAGRLRADRRRVDLVGRAVRRVSCPRCCKATRCWSRFCAVLFLMAMNLRGVRESGTTFAVPTYLFLVGILGMAALRFHPDAVGRPARCGVRAVRRPAGRGLQRRHRRPGDDVPAAAGLFLRLCSADRRRGDQQRRAGVPEAQGQERRHHPAAAGRFRDRDGDEHPHPRERDGSAHRRRPRDPAGDRDGRTGVSGVPPGPGDQPARDMASSTTSRSASTSSRR